VTVKELHTFTDAEIETIADALAIADAHYRSFMEVVSLGRTRDVLRSADFRETFERQAREASDLRLKIEAAK